MDSSHGMYHPALALEIIGAIFLLLGALSCAIILLDILVRHGWRSMMGIMIPVYTITGLYLGPLGVLFYLKYGRPPASSPTRSDAAEPAVIVGRKEEESSASSVQTSATAEAPASHCCHSKTRQPDPELASPCHSAPAVEAPVAAAHCHSHAKKNAYWVTVFAGVTHCGAGCVLGDLVGEWLVYGTSASISGRSLWAELLIDYAFALLFGVGFQYFSIAPMSGHWGWRTVWRAIKADVVSLTSFEVGAFGWMIAFQLGIWGDKDLDMVSTTYWWMMQIGMCLGFATAYPVNWLLIKYKIKEPCV